MKDFCNISEIYKNNIELFKDLESLLTSKKFPCLFAMNSFHKNHMYVYDASNLEEREYSKIYNQLSNFSKYIKKYNKEKNFYTIILVIKGPQETSPEFLKDFIFSFLIKLKEYDSTNETITKNDILKNNFQFSLDSDIWFPVFLYPEHISTIRRANISIIAFQPNQTFDLLKQHPNNFYEKTRKATHNRIDKIYNFKRPFFLSEKSSGINAIQYLGFDPIHPNES